MTWTKKCLTAMARVCTGLALLLLLLLLWNKPGWDGSTWEYNRFIRTTPEMVSRTYGKRPIRLF